MNLLQFRKALSEKPESELIFQFASGEQLAAHFHVTEVGKVSKDFIDCGGTRRATASCVLQTLVANDVDHRLTAGKLNAIFQHAEVLGLTEDLSVEAEIQSETIGIFELAESKASGRQLIFELAAKRTACLAPDQCGLDLFPSGDEACCGDTGCC